MKYSTHDYALNQFSRNPVLKKAMDLIKQPNPKQRRLFLRQNLRQVMTILWSKNSLPISAQKESD
jgi:hypothetical protein